MTKDKMHLLISQGLLAAAALVVGCTSERGDVSAYATDGVAEISATCNDSCLSVSLKNVGKKPILVDRELVFLWWIRPLEKDGKVTPPEDELIAPKSPSRFVVLDAGESVRRTIRWNEPYKVFFCGVSCPQHKVTAYESYFHFPRKEDISEIEIGYGHSYGTREALDFYLDGAPFLDSIYEGPLRVKLLSNASSKAQNE